jgi:hypothetical protein
MTDSERLDKIVTLLTDISEKLDELNRPVYTVHVEGTDVGADRLQTMLDERRAGL